MPRTTVKPKPRPAPGEPGSGHLLICAFGDMGYVRAVCFCEELTDAPPRATYEQCRADWQRHADTYTEWS